MKNISKGRKEKCTHRSWDGREERDGDKEVYIKRPKKEKRNEKKSFNGKH